MAHTYVLGDWGTSSLRLYLMDRDRVLEERNGPGIGALHDSPAAVLATALATWPRPSQIVLCGMASSRNGLLELPYAKAPTNATAWAQAARRLPIEGFDVLLATGIMCGDDIAGFDVMRGEEAQVFGAMRIDTALLRGKHCVVLPGTHCKWVDVDDGSVVRLRTAMTGELYSLLTQHSILLKPSGPGERGLEFDAGFGSGVERGHASAASLLTDLFQARTAQLLQGRTARWATGFISGLLIGYELATLTRSVQRDCVTVVGDVDLASLYRRAFGAAGISVRVIDGAAAAMCGLQLLREHYNEVQVP